MASSASGAAVDLAADVAVVSHAGGRMGKLIVAQLRETWAEAGVPLTVRALVRDRREAEAFASDVAGVVVRGGVACTNPLEGVEVIVVGYPDAWPQLRSDELAAAQEARDALVSAFEGATVAVLCDSAHAEVAEDFEVYGSGGGARVRVEGPKAQSRSAALLLAELDAAREASARSAPQDARLRHVVLRSTMGVACAARAERDELAARACARMGGLLTTVGKMGACEAALRESALPHTVVRWSSELSRLLCLSPGDMEAEPPPRLLFKVRRAHGRRGNGAARVRARRRAPARCRGG